MDTWLQSWTIFYWAWWVSWTPFVGMFIARISRGRTIRQFVAGGVLLVPSVVSLVWFAVFGGAAINVQQGGTDLAGEGGGVEEQLFTLLEQFPIATVASVIVMILVAIFFVSGATPPRSSWGGRCRSAARSAPPGGARSSSGGASPRARLPR